MGVFQTMFLSSDQVRGRPVASLRPSRVGPRKSGQLVCAKAAPFSAAYKFVSRKTEEKRVKQVPASAQIGSEPEFGDTYTSPLANVDRTVTRPNAEKSGCRDLWVPDLYGEFCGVCENCGHHFPLEYEWYLKHLLDRDSIDEFNAEISAGSVAGNNNTYDSYELTAEGAGQVVVKALGADLDASTLSGLLDVTLRAQSLMGSVKDVDIKLNSSSASVNTLASDSTAVTLDAAAMGSGDTLSLAGAGAVGIFNADNGVTIDGKTGITVDGSVVDFGGTLDIYTAALDASELVSVKTGSAKTTVKSAGSSSATVSIDAAKLSSSADNGDDDLVLKGTTAFVVTALGASVNAQLAEAAVDITTEASDSSADTLVVLTGSANTMVTGADAQDTIEVDANYMATGDELTIDGAADFVVTNVSTGMTVDADGDGNGSPLAGALTVTLEASATGVTVRTGDEATIVYTSGGGSVAVNAAALDDNKLLTLDGAANAAVTAIIGNVDADHIEKAPGDYSLG